MLVRALAACFIDGQRRRAGAEFEYAGDVLPAHLVPAKNSAPPAVPKPDQPIALSQLAQSGNKPMSFVESVARKKPSAA